MQASLPLSPPPGLTRREVLALVDETGRALGITPACLQVLARMIGSTANDDWRDPERTPVYFGKQESLAERLGISARQIRNHERRLADLGLVAPSPLGNGHRSAAGSWGISLAPLRDRLAELLERRDELRATHARKRSLKVERSVARRRAMDLLRQATDAELRTPEIEMVAERVLKWPRADRLLRLKLAELDGHVAEAVKTVERLETLLGAPRTADPDAEGEGRRIRAVPTAETLAKLGDLTDPAKLVEMATPQFRVHALAAGPPTEASVMAAAEARRGEIGVGWEPWAEAVETMGREVASMALLLIDANRSHPQNPVRKPAGALRGLARKFAVGQFNLAGGLIALERRRRRERGEPGG